MGIFNKLFGEKKVFPPLEPSNPLSDVINSVRKPIENLAAQTSDPLEIVPANDATYVFIGKPPKQFGVAWVKDGKIFNLKTLAEEKSLSPQKLTDASEKLKLAYEKSQDQRRFSTQIGSSSIVVSESESLGRDMDRILQDI